MRNREAPVAAQKKEGDRKPRVEMSLCCTPAKKRDVTIKDKGARKQQNASVYSKLIWESFDVLSSIRFSNKSHCPVQVQKKKNQTTPALHYQRRYRVESSPGAEVSIPAAPIV
jgi:hypothetical protein